MGGDFTHPAHLVKPASQKKRHRYRFWLPLRKAFPSNHPKRKRFTFRSSLATAVDIPGNQPAHFVFVFRRGDHRINRGADGIDGVVLRPIWGGFVIRHHRDCPPDSLHIGRQSAVVLCRSKAKNRIIAPFVCNFEASKFNLEGSQFVFARYMGMFATPMHLFAPPICHW